MDGKKERIAISGGDIWGQLILDDQSWPHDWLLPTNGSGREQTTIARKAF
jgi:hypothetical protein